jgi:hypothetical protein
MKTLSTTTCLLALSLASGAACDAPAPEFGAGEVTNRCSLCGIKFNTNKLGDYPLSEIPTEFGVPLGDVVLDAVEVKRLGKVDEVWVETGRIFGKKDGLQLVDSAFLGSYWYLRIPKTDGLGNPFPGTEIEVKMHLVGIATAPSGVRLYTWEHMVEGGPKEWTPNCDQDPDVPGVQFASVLTEDIVVDHKTGAMEHRPGTAFIGCTSGGVGKAGYWGYPRHEVGLGGLEAAVRMVRADYCGTGDSFTEPGQPLTIEDAWGVSTHPAGVPLKNEALWGKSGALCVGQPRLDAVYSDALSVQKRCDELGAPVPDECDATASMASYGGDVLFWTKNVP